MVIIEILIEVLCQCLYMGTRYLLVNVKEGLFMNKKVFEFIGRLFHDTAEIFILISKKEFIKATGREPNPEEERTVPEAGEVDLCLEMFPCLQDVITKK